MASPVSSAPTPSTTWKGSHAPHGYVGAIVGGVLGAVAILGVFVMGMLIWRHRRRQRGFAKSASFDTSEEAMTSSDAKGAFRRAFHLVALANVALTGSAATSAPGSYASTPREQTGATFSPTRVQWEDGLQVPGSPQRVT